MTSINQGKLCFPDSKKKIETAIGLAVKYLAYRSRTTVEMENYIKKKGFDQDTCKSVIEYLISQNYLNDKDYCRSFLEYRSKFKSKSTFALQYELTAKGIDASIIDPILSGYDDEELAQNAVDPKLKQWQHLSTEKFKKKVINFLRYRGFSYSVCLSTLDNIDNKLRGQNEN